MQEGNNSQTGNLLIQRRGYRQIIPSGLKNSNNLRSYFFITSYNIRIHYE